MVLLSEVGQCPPCLQVFAGAKRLEIGVIDRTVAEGLLGQLIYKVPGKVPGIGFGKCLIFRSDVTQVHQHVSAFGALGSSLGEDRSWVRFWARDSFMGDEYRAWMHGIQAYGPGFDFPGQLSSADRAKPMAIRDGGPRLPLTLATLATLGEGNAAIGADFDFGVRSLGSLSRTLEPRRGKP